MVSIKVTAIEAKNSTRPISVDDFTSTDHRGKLGSALDRNEFASPPPHRSWCGIYKQKPHPSPFAVFPFFSSPILTWSNEDCIHQGTFDTVNDFLGTHTRSRAHKVRGGKLSLESATHVRPFSRPYGSDSVREWFFIHSSPPAQRCSAEFGSRWPWS